MILLFLWLEQIEKLALMFGNFSAYGVCFFFKKFHFLALRIDKFIILV
jgi:hypothetical protein